MLWIWNGSKKLKGIARSRRTVASRAANSFPRSQDSALFQAVWLFVYDALCCSKKKNDALWRSQAPDEPSVFSST